MKIRHDPQLAKLPLGIRIGTTICHREGGYFAEYDIYTGDGTVVTVDPEEAKAIIAQLNEKLIELAAVDGDAYQLGVEFYGMGRK